MSDIIMEVQNLEKQFIITKSFGWGKLKVLKAVNGVNLVISRGKTLGLVGESGCGKSTVGRLISKLLEPSNGKIIFKGDNVTLLSRDKLKSFRREVQVIFQDPLSSLNPRHKIKNILMEPLIIHNIGSKAERTARVNRIMEIVGLRPSDGDKHPYEFSGGQRQRIAIARALIINPSFVVCDEPVSALDVSIQAQILNLLRDLQQEFSLTYLFIGHGLNTVKYISDMVAVMYLGKIVEIGLSKQLFKQPLHPYTKALLSSIPINDPQDRGRQRVPVTGDPPSPINLPSGCFFHPRCSSAIAVCKIENPILNGSKEHQVACHRA